MQQAQLRKDPLAVARLYTSEKIKTRPSGYPEPVETHPSKARKVRPLDYLSGDERRIAAELEHGGIGAILVRRTVANKPTPSRWWWSWDACAYQVWLFDRRPEA